MSSQTAEIDAPQQHLDGARRGILAGAGVTLVTVVFALAMTSDADVPLRDPGNVSLRRLLTTAVLIAAIALIDAVRRARHGRLLPRREHVADTLRDRWSGGRVTLTVCAIASFYVTYFAYRNIKSVVPLVRPTANYDGSLMDLDQSLFGKGGPAHALQSLLGTDLSAHALSQGYMLFFLFIPVVLAVALVVADDLRVASFVVTALALNWTLGAASYLMLPSLGPFHAAPAEFIGLPVTAVSHLQDTLLFERAEFLRDPQMAGTAQSIGAFASLHVSIYTTVALAAHVLRAPRALKALLWALTAMTVVATLYFGWHYLADDVAGVVIAVIALALARLVIGPWRTAA
ncbi:MAG: hypothetical protein QOF76_1331 [Solirubrobacteraceae bacterium]|jgi:hypothetical protein|nr:hypothetical protein [Solirubrobacteraceae bacterium]